MLLWLALRGWSKTDLIRLDREWQELIAEVAPLPQESGNSESELERLTIRAEELGARQAWKNWATEMETGHSLRDLGPDLRQVLSEMAKEIEAGRYSRAQPGGQAGFTSFYAALSLLLSDEELTAQTARSLARYARTIQREGTQASLNLGRVSLNILLERAQQEPEILKVLQEIDPPAPGELFAAVFRGQVMLASEFTNPGEPIGGALSSPDAPESYGVRAAILKQAEEVRPLRDQPDQFESLPPPTVPGRVWTFLAAQFGTPSLQIQIKRSLLDAPFDEYGKTWSDFLERWEQVVGEHP